MLRTLILGGFLWATAQAFVWANNDQLRPITLQLKWDPEFQFAGYYAAQWQGYYEEVGLTVTLVPRPTLSGQLLNVAEQVESGKAHFGIGGPDILIHRDEGRPLVVIASIFQNSPFSYFSLKNGPVQSLKDFADARISSSRDFGLVELRALAKREGFHIQDTQIVDYQFGLSALSRNEAEVALDYAVSGRWAADRKKMSVHEFKASDFGIQFYGDLLYTTKDLIEKDPEMVDLFLHASIRGWQYALANEAEVARRLAAMPRVFPYEDPLSYNLHEAGVVKELMNYPVIPIGHTSAERWEKIHTYLKELGIVKKPFVFNDFFFNYHDYLKKQSMKFESLLAKVFFVLIILFGIFWLVRFWKSNNDRKRLLFQLKESEMRLQYALEASNEGLWDYKTNGKLYLNRNWYQMLGYEPNAFEADLDIIVGSVHPEDQERFLNFYRDSLSKSKGESIKAEYRMQDSSGEYRWILNKAKVVDLDAVGSYKRVVGTHTDITNQKLVENRLADLNSELESRVRERTRALVDLADKLKTSETKLKEVLDTIPLGVAWKDTQLKYMGCNARFAFDLDLHEADQLIGKMDKELNWLCEVEAFDRSDKRALSGEFIALSDIKVSAGNRKDTCYYRFFKAPFMKDKKGASGVLIVSEDITAQKLIEEQNLNNLNLLEAVLDGSPDQISIIEYAAESDRFILGNPALLQWFGRAGEDISGLPMSDIMGNELAERIKIEDRAVLNLGREHQVELWMKNVFGVRRLFNVMKTPFRNRNEQIIGILSVARDITDRRATEMIHQTFYEYSTEPHVLLDGLNILYANQAFSHALGLTDESLLQGTDISFYFAQSGKFHIDEYIEYQSISIEKGMQRFEWQYQHPSFGVRTYEVTQIPVDYLDGVALMEVWHDVEDRVRETQELKQAKKLAEETAESKSRFLANMSHEIRTPMNAILGFSQVALMKSPKETTAKYLRYINEAASSLLAILNDILDLSKLEAKALQIHREPTHLVQLIKAIMVLEFRLSTLKQRRKN